MDRLITRMAIRIAALLAAAIIFVGGLGFLVLAAYLALLDHMSPPRAALVAALTAFILAGLTLLAARAIIAMMRRRHQREADKLAEAFRDILGDEIVALATENPHATALTSLITGFAVGAVPELRHVLRDLLRRP